MSGMRCDTHAYATFMAFLLCRWVLLMFSVALPLYFCPLYFSGVIPVLCSASGVQVEVQTTSKSQTRRLR